MKDTLRNILFLLIDDLRADRCLNRGMNDPYDTPFLRYLCQNGTSFSQAISAASFTTPSVASILTGMYPFGHGIEWFAGTKLNPNIPTMPELLEKSGYSTCAMVTGPLTSHLGLDRGFNKYIYRYEGENIYNGLKGTLGKCLKDAREPWFLFVHLWELHYPIYLPGSLKRKYEFSRHKYDKALSCLDHQLAEIVEKVNLDETIIIFTADHGERLPNIIESVQRSLLASLLSSPTANILGGAGREEGKKKGKEKRRLQFLLLKRINRHLPQLQMKQGHGFNISDPLIRVPLIFAGNGFPKNKVMSEQVSHVDIAPTVLDSLGLLHHLNGEIHGISLLTLLKGDLFPERAIYVGPAGMRDVGLDEVENTKNEWIEGLRTPEWKYISRYEKDQPLALYDLEDDPEESRNLVNVRTDMVKLFGEEMRRLKADRPLHKMKMTWEEEKSIRSRLKALGYI